MQERTCLPLFYHPSTVLVLDDDSDFANNICLMFSKIAPGIVFTEPEKALEYLKNHTYRLDELSQVLSEQDFTEPNLEIDLFRLHFKRLLKDPMTSDRFKMILAGCIDHKMAQMLGLDFCSEILREGLQVSRIILTGYMGAQGAISAFNEQIINAYVQKEDPDLHEKLRSILQEQMWREFQEITLALTGSFSHVLKPLYNEKFIDLFKSIFIKNSVAEFYLLDATCSYLLIDSKGNMNVLLVRQPEDFRVALDLAKDSGGSDFVLDKIKNCESYPYSPNDPYYKDAKGAGWGSLLVSMEKVPESNFYYALVDGQKDFDFLPYEKYLTQK